MADSLASLTGPGFPQVLFEDNHLLIVNKPFCMPSQGDESGDLNLFDWAKEYVRIKYNKPGNVYMALLHRLDRPAGGILALAKTSKAAERMSKLFQKRQVQKIYFAITENTPRFPEGELKHFVKQLENKNIMRAYDKEVSGSKIATLDYRQIKKQGKRALLEVNLGTGRKHQIRLQLADMGCGIVGDVKYAETQFLPDKSIALFAHSLSFVHPVQKEKITVTAPWPETALWQELKP